MTDLAVAEARPRLGVLPEDENAVNAADAANAAAGAVTVVAPLATTLLQYREELIALTAQAFSAPPWTETPVDAVRVVDRMWCNLGRRDFLAVIALDGDHLAGYAYGYTDTRCAALAPGRDSPASAFEVIELAVAPAYQGRGIGRDLHDALLADAPSPRLLLTHPEAPARRRYRNWGWAELGPVDAGSGRTTILMRHDAG